MVRRPVWRAVRRYLGTLAQVSTTMPVAAITFDDGPHPRFTPKTIELLERFGARGTFFMVGEAAQRYPRVVARVAAGGHVIANHSWNHPSFRLIPRRERWRQVAACEQTLAPYGSRLFRPPYLHQHYAARLDLFRMGYQVVGCSLAAEDSKEPDAEKMATHLISEIGPGSIVLLHDALFTVLPDRLPDRSAMLEALERLLSELTPRFRFLTIPELMRVGRPILDASFGRAPAGLLDQVRRALDDYEAPDLT